MAVDLFDASIALVAQVWQTDAEMRRRSLFGQSPMERRSGRIIGITCGVIIALLGIAAFAIAVFT